MVDEPKTGGKNNDAEPEKSSASPVTGALTGDTPTTTGQIQTESTSKKGKYTEYIVWPFVATWSLFRKAFLLADKHNGGITALATVAIVFLTTFYVIYSRAQWRVMRQQLEEMKKTTGMQRQVARAANGTPNVRRTGLGVYHDKLGKMWVKAFFHNVEKIDAEDSMVSIKLDFLTLPPNQIQRTFLDGEFKNMTPSKMRPIPEDEILAPIFYRQYIDPEIPGKNIYVWGEFRYKDFGDWDEPTKFCWYAEAKQVLSKESAREGAEGGYVSGWQACD